MEVAYFIGSLHRGGAETLLLDVFRNHKLASYDMHLIYRNGGEYLPDFQQTQLPCKGISVHGKHLLSGLLHLRKYLKQEHITIIHAQHILECVYGWLASRGLHISIVLTFHGYMGAEESLSVLQRLLYKIAIAMADKCCFVSEVQQQQYRECYGKMLQNKCEVVYNGIDFSKLDLASNVSLNSHLSSLNTAVPKLCMVGNFISARQHLLIIQALQQLNKRNPQLQVELYLIGRDMQGESNAFSLCRAYCLDNEMTYVHFLGGRGDVPVLLQQMDGFVYATKAETFGIAVVEAMATGLPVVVNDHPVMKEITHHGEWATLFKSDDVDACTHAIEDLLSHLEERKATAKDTTTQVRATYSIEKHIDRLIEIYNYL